MLYNAGCLQAKATYRPSSNLQTINSDCGILLTNSKACICGQHFMYDAISKALRYGNASVNKDYTVLPFIHRFNMQVDSGVAKVAEAMN